MTNVTYTIDSYTAAWDDAMRPAAPEVGETYRVPEDPRGTGQTADGREIDGFLRACSRAGVRGAYSHTEDGWDVYDLVRDED